MAKPFYDVGPYIGEILQQGLTTASTGTVQFVLRVKVLGVPAGDGYTPNRQQYERSIYMALTEKTESFVVPILQKLGFHGGSLATLDPGHPQHQSFLGDQVDLWCSHNDDGKGGTREQWSVSMEGAQRELVPVDPKKLRQLDALFSKSFSGSKAKPARAKEEPAPEKAYFTADSQEITDDDIPF